MSKHSKTHKTDYDSVRGYKVGDVIRIRGVAYTVIKVCKDDLICSSPNGVGRFASDCPDFHGLYVGQSVFVCISGYTDLGYQPCTVLGFTRRGTVRVRLSDDALPLNPVRIFDVPFDLIKGTITQDEFCFVK